MFEILTKTKTRLLDVVVLSQKNRQPDDNPGAKLSVEMMLSNDMLAYFDGSLRGFLFTKNPVAALSTGKGGKQGELEGIEQLELTEIGAHVKRIPWVYDQTGCTIEIDRGLGGSSNLVLRDCTVHRVSFQPQKGVSARVQWTIDAPGQSDAVRGKLTGMKATELPITQVGPAVDGQQDLTSHAPRLTPAQLRQANAEGKTVEQKAAEVNGAGEAVDAWPFPKKTLAQDATTAVLADVEKNGPAGAAPAKKASRRPAAGAH